jgi:hypothetical protein
MGSTNMDGLARRPELAPDKERAPAAFPGPARGILERTGEGGDVLGLAMCDCRSGAGHRRARWTSASKPSWPTFSRSRAKNRTSSAWGAGARRL